VNTVALSNRDEIGGPAADGIEAVNRSGKSAIRQGVQEFASPAAN